MDKTTVTNSAKSIQALSDHNTIGTEAQVGFLRKPSSYSRKNDKSVGIRSRSLWEIENEGDSDSDDGLDDMAHKHMAAAERDINLYKMRDKWETRLDFDISTLAVGIGLGNVWKLALVVFENGQGAFFFPYVTCLLLLAIPLYFTEASLGQFSSSGAIRVWDMAPIFRGVGFSTMTVVAFTSGFYGAITSMCFHYMTQSFTNPLPWSVCNTEYYSTSGRFLFKNFTCKNTEGIHWYVDKNNREVKNLTLDSAELYFRYGALQTSDNLNNGFGYPDVSRSVELFCVWAMVFLTVMLGTRSMSRGAYLQTLLPFLILFLLFLKSFFHDGSTDGIQKFFTPDWKKLASTELWHDALNQAFFTLSNGFGVHMTLNSYNPLHQMSYKETVMLAGIDTFVTLTAGMTIAASVGAVARSRNATVEDILKERRGAGLAFITYPKLLSSFSASGLPQIYSVLFFAMLVALGVGSIAGHIMSLMGCLFDMFPLLAKGTRYRILATFAVCLIFFCNGLLFLTPGGPHLQGFILDYTTEIMVFLVTFFEAFGIFYIYGVQNWVVDLRFLYNIEGTLGNCFLRVYRIWGYVIPWLLLAFLAHIMYFDLLTSPEKSISTHYLKFTYPQAFYYIGIALVAITVTVTPLTALIVLCTAKGQGFRECWSISIQPSDKWGPKKSAHKADWIFHRMISQGCSFAAGMHSGIATKRHRVRVEDVARFQRMLQASHEIRKLSTAVSAESFNSSVASSSCSSLYSS